MAYFPFFVDLTGQRGLIAGGGTVALRKAEKLIPYGPALTVAAPDLLPGFEALPGLTLLRRPFTPRLREGMRFVIAANGDPALNHRIAALCRERGVLVNVVDDRDWCTFLFPALVREGPLSVGISTGGASPTGAVWVKERLEGLLPEGFGGLLEWLESVRTVVQEALPGPQSRGPVFARLFGEALELGRPLTGAELAAVLEQAGGLESSRKLTVDKVEKGAVPGGGMV